MEISEVDKMLANINKQNYYKRYINTKEIKYKRLYHIEFETKLRYLLTNNYTKLNKYKSTKRDHWIDKSFILCYEKGKKQVSLQIYEDNNFIRYISKCRDDKNKVSKSALAKLNNEFKKRTGKCLTKAFGKSPQYFKKCAPSPLYYQNQVYAIAPSFIHNVCEEDFSSHYPAEALLDLPDAKTWITVPGRVLPNEEYKFAFYPETGHIAIYNEFDTHNFIREQNKYKASEEERIYKTDYLGHETETVLMKAAKERIAELEVNYAIKNTYLEDTEEYNDAKLVLNKFIGEFEQNNKQAYNKHPFAHLAAVIKWRANIKMFRLIKQIGEQNVIQVCVDGLLHKGPAIGTYEKKLGNLVIKEENAKMIQRGINQYIVFGKEIHKCHQGLDLNIESNNILDWQASAKVDFKKYINEICELE